MLAICSGGVAQLLVPVFCVKAAEKTLTNNTCLKNQCRTKAYPVFVVRKGSRLNRISGRNKTSRSYAPAVQVFPELQPAM